MTEIFKISNLKGGYTLGVNILQDVNIEIHEGESIGIIGLNGSGKSTLGKAIMNMIPYREGDFLFKGENINHLSTSELAQLGISIMQQGGRVFTNLSVWDNLLISFGNQKNNDYISELKSIIPLMDMPKNILKTKMADKLSGGERHQLALAMALTKQPQLLILDEPSAGLSPKAVDEMYNILDIIQKSLNTTIILIEQNIKKICKTCTHCYQLETGKIVRQFLGKEINDIEKIIFNQK